MCWAFGVSNPDDILVGFIGVTVARCPDEYFPYRREARDNSNASCATDICNASMP